MEVLRLDLCLKKVVLLTSLSHLLSREDILSIFFSEGKRAPDSIGQSALLSPVFLLGGQCLSPKDHPSFPARPYSALLPSVCQRSPGMLFPPVLSGQYSPWMRRQAQGWEIWFLILTWVCALIPLISLLFWRMIPSPLSFPSILLKRGRRVSLSSLILSVEETILRWIYSPCSLKVLPNSTSPFSTKQFNVYGDLLLCSVTIFCRHYFGIFSETENKESHK